MMKRKAKKDVKKTEDVSQPVELEKIVNQIIEENPNLILEYKAGIKSSLMKLIAKVSERTGGKADPKKIKDIIIKKV